jgi:hypothetical protein
VLETLVNSIALPRPYRVRPYRGPNDHVAMARVLTAYRDWHGDPQTATAAELDSRYALLSTDNTLHRLAIVERNSEIVGYCRLHSERMKGGQTHLLMFSPWLPQFIDECVFDAVLRGMERHSYAVARAHRNSPVVLIEFPHL